MELRTFAKGILKQLAADVSAQTGKPLSEEQKAGLKKIVTQIQDQQDLVGQFITLAKEPDAVSNDRKLNKISGCLGEIILSLLKRYEEAKELNRLKDKYLSKMKEELN